jgi:hypothetical protein
MLLVYLTVDSSCSCFGVKDDFIGDTVKMYSRHQIINMRIGGK